MKILLALCSVLLASACGSVPKPNMPASSAPAAERCQRPGEWVVRNGTWVCKQPRTYGYHGGIPYGAQIVGYVTPPAPTPPDQYGRYQSPPSHLLAPIPVYAMPLPFSCLWPCMPYRYGYGNGFTFIMKF